MAIVNIPGSNAPTYISFRVPSGSGANPSVTTTFPQGLYTAVIKDVFTNVTVGGATFNSANASTQQIVNESSSASVSVPTVWTSRSSSVPTSIAAFNGSNRYAAYLNNAAFNAWSSDGITWTTVSNGTNSNASATKMRYLNNQFFATYSAGQISRSSDGATWTQRGVGGTNTTFYDAAHGNGTYILAGVANGTEYNFSSTDAVTWTQRSGMGSAPGLSAAFGNGRWMIGNSSGNIYWTTNITTWNGVGVFSSISVQSLEYLNGIFFAGSNQGDVKTSTDGGVTWTTRNTRSALMNSQVTGFSYIAPYYIASSTYSTNPTVSQIAWSTDLVNWTSRANVHPSQINSMQTFGSTLYAFGSSSITSSTNPFGVTSSDIYVTLINYGKTTDARLAV